jgi:hypothetical protein
MRKESYFLWCNGSILLVKKLLAGRPLLIASEPKPIGFFRSAAMQERSRSDRGLSPFAFPEGRTFSHIALPLMGSTDPVLEHASPRERAQCSVPSL